MAKADQNLLGIVVADLWQHRYVVLLALAVLINAVVVVLVSHESRQLISHWDQLMQKRDQLDIEWRNLLLEEQSQAEHSRITQIATKELHMNRPLPSEEVVVRRP
ncbi:cell division protein FtsL [Shewanella sp. NIFS-20-20]|uniref:cell division protein FtsL n=1 Tax=Shewanella sp. NIFS-20-20 TaxID=2853806 RepID=UPI001C450D0E|nr:cell division protein FtsL [Shewanella sp. NIFS-20-20]MBV7315750.1 cell division protein FtsL [Shewanella sp. NIFS-20-20]